MGRPVKGIRRRGKKWWAFVRVHGHLYTKTFDLTDLDAARQWRQRQRDIVPAPTLRTGQKALTQREHDHFLSILTDVAASNGHASEPAVQHFLAEVRDALTTLV
jgi:hypothetical protein